jgi:RNA recognition motif-containing protein
MQDILNKMVVSVRKGYIGPEDASRTIHECGALLGVQLAAEMPATTIAITGLRKNATGQDIYRAFSKFGQVVTAEVAPNQRGFGILRFSTEDAVNKAMDNFKTVGEVVVHDVGAQLKAIRPESQTKENGDETNGNGQIP